MSEITLKLSKREMEAVLLSRLSRGWGVKPSKASLAAEFKIADKMEPRHEVGPAHVGEYLAQVAQARKTGVGLRAALVQAAMLFIWWAARLPSAGSAVCRQCGEEMAEATAAGICGLCVAEDGEQAA